MNALVTRLRPLLVANPTTSLATRSTTYQVTPSGDKIVIAQRDGSSKREKWQRVFPMGREPRLRDIKRIEMNERTESDTSVARRTASAKLRSMEDSLRARGFCRETKSYSPPQNVDQVVEECCRSVFAIRTDQKWTDIALNGRSQKFEFLTKCAKQLNYDVPNSALYRMRSVSDVLEFYSTPIRGISSYDQMVQNADQLPPNLHVIGEPILYNQETDTFFGGINAYPFSTYQIKGLRAKKKYPHFNKRFVWPDV